MTRYGRRPKSSVGPAAAAGGVEAPAGNSVTVRLTVTRPAAGHAFRCTVMLPAAEHARVHESASAPWPNTLCAT